MEKLKTKGDDLETIESTSANKKMIDNEGNPSTVERSRESASKPQSKLRKSKTDSLKNSESSKHRKRVNQYEELRSRYFSDPSKYKQYRNLKYKSHIYKVQDAVLILNEDDPTNDFICKLLNIYRYDEDDRTLVFIEVQWYYKKSDIAKHFPSLVWSISENELFLSHHRDIVLVECINGSCSVVTFKEYDALNSIQQNTFFCR